MTFDYYIYYCVVIESYKSILNILLFTFNNQKLYESPIV